MTTQQFNLNEQVIVNTGDANHLARIVEKQKSPHIWKQGDGTVCYLCKFNNETTQYIPSNYITTAIQADRVHIYGNKLVIHFLCLLNQSDKAKAEVMTKNNGDIFGVDTQYKIALSKSKILGGKKYHNKKFGGGIAFDFNRFTVTGLVEKLNEIK